ncbi:hypothetical protein [Aeromonas sp. 5HA1]|uniref:hypothetical protein n=1 Tax=Aeromonas sp. 5HA1 TaxID=2699197 RepID=UPI0023DDF5DB|nr:hypothetical protein [Aeromonas sp. 5HA1]EIS3739133.1 hypothetical protein [Aeromonas hydrophila]MDF2400429.1 hypothetical protein [Aeromonas sp. 5HA1]
MSSPAEASVVATFLLYDFAPFLSVAMAINFVSSFWDGVKDKAINNFDKHKEGVIKDLNAVYSSGNCESSDSISDLDTEANGYKSFLKWLSLIATILGIIISILLFIALAWIGFYPKTMLTNIESILLVVISIFPSTIFRVWGAIYSKSSIKKLEKTSNTIKTAAKAAIRDNQQAAYTAK